VQAHDHRGKLHRVVAVTVRLADDVHLHDARVAFGPDIDTHGFRMPVLGEVGGEVIVRDHVVKNTTPNVAFERHDVIGHGEAICLAVLCRDVTDVYLHCI